ncbi:hypothetical protein MLD38_015083 [Melastoma candidum]|uniref:Uncharacterized protein n=1 Tax=Melastoma candidum TaxID=119954 RepID=A0ACB9RIN2_9MYRT|nr:hypothetical protein MLD38_015083 [Melastoma candidum]
MTMILRTQKNQSLKLLSSELKDMTPKASEAYRGSGTCVGPGAAPRFMMGKGGSSGREVMSRSGTGRGRSEPAAIVFVEEKEPKEWVAHVEPGVLIDLLCLPGEVNDLRRIRFR